MKRLPAKSALLILTLAIFLPLGQHAVAKRGQKHKNDIPYFRDILFSERSIGFISRKRGTKKVNYFILFRKAASLQPVNKDLFFKSFDYREDIIPAEKQKQFTILKASNGREYKTKNAYCAEFSRDTHKLWEKERLLKDNVKPCHSISSVEIVGNQLWLATRIDGEGKEYDADGIIIISLEDSKLVGKIDDESGLNGNLVRVIRLDPFSGKIWAATGVGLTVINKNHKVESRNYLYEDFDPDTGKPVFYLTSKFKESILLAVIARQNGAGNTIGYYEVAKKMPKKIRLQFTLHLYKEAYGTQTKRFLPEEMNVLVPFFIDASNPESDDHTTSPLSFLCSFNDARVLNYFTSIQIKNPFKDKFLYGLAIRSARDCIDKYARLGLLDESYKLKRSAMLLEKIKKALAEIRSGNVRSSLYSATSVNEAPKSLKKIRTLQDIKKALAEIRSGNVRSSWQSANTAIEATKSLKEMGNLQGFKLLEEYFATFDIKRAAKNRGYLFAANELYSAIRSRLYSYKEITPTILNGIKKGFLKGCRYFDTRFEISYGKHLDAKYAEAIVVAMDLADERPQDLTDYWAVRSVYSNEDINKIEISDPCEVAFRSQVKNESVYDNFMENYFPKLTKRQKELTDQLLSGKYQQDVEKIRRKIREKKQQNERPITIRLFPRTRP